MSWILRQVWCSVSDAWCIEIESPPHDDRTNKTLHFFLCYRGHAGWMWSTNYFILRTELANIIGSFLLLFRTTKDRELVPSAHRQIYSLSQQFTDWSSVRKVCVRKSVRSRAGNWEWRRVKYFRVEMYDCSLGNTTFHFWKLSPSIKYHKLIVAIITIAYSGFKCLKQQVMSQAIMSLMIILWDYEAWLLDHTENATQWWNRSFPVLCF